MVKKIAVTMGDAAGVGPELAVRAAAKFNSAGKVELTIFGDSRVVAEAQRRFGDRNTFIPIVECGRLEGELIPGIPSGECGKIAYQSIRQATMALLAGEFDALVTAPANKYAVNLAGIEFSGHTELIAQLCGVSDYVMMQSAGELRVAFATTHIPLREVAEQVTVPRIKLTANLLIQAIKEEKGCSFRPKIALAALNPHAGENGCIGDEDETITKLAALELRGEDMDISDPIVPDVLFLPEIREHFDGIVSLYHDQGHIPFKMLAFDRGVNSTLGLPIIRTSPDHGTAFDRAWGKGLVDEGSFFAAVELAIARAENRKNCK